MVYLSMLCVVILQDCLADALFKNIILRLSGGGVEINSLTKLLDFVMMLSPSKCITTSVTLIGFEKNSDDAHFTCYVVML